MARGPVNRRYILDYHIPGDVKLTLPDATAPLRVQREWVEALQKLYPGATATLTSIPLTNPALLTRQLKPVAHREPKDAAQ